MILSRVRGNIVLIGVGIVRRALLSSVGLFFLVAIPHLALAQKYKEVKPTEVVASSFYEDPGVHITYQYKKYAKYIKENSPGMVADGIKESSWSPDGKKESEIGAWVRLNYAYPIRFSKIRLLTGYQMGRGSFSSNKRVKKFRVFNEHGESKKYTFKATSEAITFNLKFKKPSTSIGIEILEVENENSKNKDFTVGFAEVSLYQQSYSSAQLDQALVAGEWKTIKKLIKKGAGEVLDKNGIRSGEKSLLEVAMSASRPEVARNLWKEGFRFDGATNQAWNEVESAAELEQLLAANTKANAAYEQWMKRLNGSASAVSIESLSQLLASIDTEFKTLNTDTFTKLKEGATQKRAEMAYAQLEGIADEFSQNTAQALPSLDKLKYPSFSEAHANQISFLSRNQVPNLRRKLAQAQRSLLNRLKEETIQELNQRFSDLRHIEETQLWYESFKAKHQPIMAEYAMTLVDDHFKSKRSQLLKNSTAQIAVAFTDLTSMAACQKRLRLLSATSDDSELIAQLRTAYNGRTAQLRSEYLKRENKAYRWLDMVRNAEFITPRALLNKVGAFSISKNQESSQGLIKVFLESRGLSVDPDSRYIVSYSSDIDLLTYTKKLDGVEIKKVDVIYEKEMLRVLTRGMVFREGKFLDMPITINHASNGIISEYDEMLENTVSITEGLFKSVFMGRSRNTDDKIAWSDAIDLLMDDAPTLYSAYKNAEFTTAPLNGASVVVTDSYDWKKRFNKMGVKYLEPEEVPANASYPRIYSDHNVKANTVAGDIIANACSMLYHTELMDISLVNIDNKWYRFYGITWGHFTFDKKTQCVKYASPNPQEETLNAFQQKVESN